MKKILFATTALVATAGFAAADVAITGSAEMGIIGGERYGADNDGAQFHTDVDVTFKFSGEADNGLSFGGSIDLDESDGSGKFKNDDEVQGLEDASNIVDDVNGIVGEVNDILGGVDVAGSSGAFGADKQGGETIFVSFGGATLTMGDTDGAFDKAMREVNVAAGSIADDETEHAGFNANAGLDGTFDGQIVRFDYAFGSFTGSISAEADDGRDVDDGGPVLGLGVAYSTELAGLTLGVGLGYQTQEDVGDLWGLSVDTKFNNGILAAINYSQLNLDEDGADDITHVGIGFGYVMNALSLGVNFGKFENFDGNDTSSTGFGLTAAYDMGGGLTAQFGFGSSDTDIGGVDNDSDSYSLGLSMSF